MFFRKKIEAAITQTTCVTYIRVFGVIRDFAIYNKAENRDFHYLMHFTQSLLLPLYSRMVFAVSDSSRYQNAIFAGMVQAEKELLDREGK